MKDAAKRYFVYSVLTSIIWVALNTLGLLRDSPHDS